MADLEARRRGRAPGENQLVREMALLEDPSVEASVVLQDPKFVPRAFRLCRCLEEPGRAAHVSPSTAERRPLDFHVKMLSSVCPCRETLGDVLRNADPKLRPSDTSRRKVASCDVGMARRGAGRNTPSLATSACCCVSGVAADPAGVAVVAAYSGPETAARVRERSGLCGGSPYQRRANWSVTGGPETARKSCHRHRASQTGNMGCS